MTNKPVFISVAPNGARKTKDLLPQIPLLPNELAVEADNCVKEGVSLFHLHVRDDEQKHILDAERYRAAIKAMREQVGDALIIQTTTEAVGMYEPEAQMALVKDLKPEAVSMGVREFIRKPEDEAAAKEFFHWVVAEGIFPQYILYSPDDVRYFAELQEKGVIPEGRAFILFVLGKKHAPVAIEEAYARPKDLLPFVEAFNEKLKDRDVEWAVCAFGGYENDCMVEAVKQGGHVRIGFENNHLLADQTFAPSNAALIAQFVKSIRGLGRPVATPEAMRDFFQSAARKRKAA